MLKKIKIICTLGPSSYKKSVLSQLKKLKISIFRINLSHTRLEDLSSIIRYLKKNKIKNICIDTEGAQIRTSRFSDKIFFKKNQTVSVTNTSKNTNKKIINLYPYFKIEKIKKNKIIRIGFENFKLQVISVDKRNRVLKAKVLNPGYLESNKGVHINQNINLPAFTKKDIKAIKIAKKFNVKHFAISFTNHVSDILKIRRMVKKSDFIISKIETNKAIKNLNKIVKFSNAILIDRGDLSRYVPISKIPIAQKIILLKAKTMNTPAYVATNLLETMVKSYEPTRAESNDIYSTLNSHVSGLVLAAETAIGVNPVLCAKFLIECIKEKKNENKINKNINLLFKKQNANLL